MSLAMTLVERESFLAEARVAIVSIPEAGRGPFTVPVWYLYEPGGEVRIWTGGATRKAKLLRKAERISLCVQQPTPPYKYVSIEGPVVGIEPAQFEQDLRPMAQRYLGPEAGERYVAGMESRTAERSDILVRIRPERWLSEDYSKRGE